MKAVDIRELALWVKDNLDGYWDIQPQWQEVIQGLTEYADLLESIDKAEPVIVVDYFYNDPENRGHYFNNKVDADSLPIGTELYAHPPKQEQSPIDEDKLASMSDEFTTYRDFFRKYALGSKLPPSCLVCGKSTQDFGIRHAELSDIVVCATCTQAARKLSAPVVPDEKPMPFRAYADERSYTNGWNDCRAAMLKGEK